MGFKKQARQREHTRPHTHTHTERDDFVDDKGKQVAHHFSVLRFIIFFFWTCQPVRCDGHRYVVLSKAEAAEQKESRAKEAAEQKSRRRESTSCSGRRGRLPKARLRRIGDVRGGESSEQLLQEPPYACKAAQGGR